jgi:hypothetical protein
MKSYRSIYFLIILLITSFSCKKAQKEPSFNLNGKSKLRITNQLTDSVQISINNWVYLPVNEEKVDTVITPGEVIELMIVSPTKHYFNLTVDNKKYRVFAETGKKIKSLFHPMEINWFLLGNSRTLMNS